MKKKTHPGAILTILSLIMALLTSTSCSKKMPMTTMLVQDSIRHYYPLVQGTDLTLLWRVANAGQTPLVLSDIHAVASSATPRTTTSSLPARTYC